MLLTLKRVAENVDGTFGVLIHNNIPFCLTLEPEWRDNKQNISCIPNGFYTCQKVNSPKFGSTFEIKRVPNRTHVLFHKGNLETDTLGCIILGEQFESLNGKCAILKSGKAFDEFINLTKGLITFNLQIEDAK